MRTNHASVLIADGKSRRSGAFLFFLSGMSVVAFAVSGIFVLALGTQILAGVFLVVALLARRGRKYHDLWEPFFAFFVFAFVFLTRFILVGLVSQLVPIDSLAGEILIPITLFFAVVTPILLLTKASGRSLSSLYVSRGTSDSA